MKTAGRGNPNRWVTVPNNRAHGAEGQNRSCSITWAEKQEKFQPTQECFFTWAEKQEKFQPTQECFFLTSTFIELIGTYATVRKKNRVCRPGIRHTVLSMKRSCKKSSFAAYFRPGRLSEYRCYELRCKQDI